MGENKTIHKFKIEEEELRILLSSNNHPFPELKKFLENPHLFLKSKKGKILLTQIKKKCKNLGEIPKLNQKLYDTYESGGLRAPYEIPYDARRENLSIAVFYYLFGYNKYLKIIEEYLNAICEEQSWIPPWHEGRILEIYSADTAFILAEILFLLQDRLHKNIIKKVKDSINEKVFNPFLSNPLKSKYDNDVDNWTGVTNSEIGCAFLLIEEDVNRKSKAIHKTIEGLNNFIKNSFNEDGSTTEGILYWNYGISMFLIFSEMLRASTNNKIDLFKIKKIKNIASYPSKIQLSLKVFATFSDSSETGTIFHPGIIQRMSERSHEKSLLNLITEPFIIDWFGITTLLRYILWWNGKSMKAVKISDSYLPDAGIVRLTNNIKKGESINLIVKAGDNGERHNHNDVGSFIINISGENFITDPGRGLYSKGYHDYHNSERYKNIFTNSYGHSVPKIDNNLQSAGRKFSGKILSVKKEKNLKSVNLKMSESYNIPKLKNLIRNISIINNNLILKDKYLFSNNSPKIEEAFITWLDVIVRGNTAIISGKNNKLILTIKEPKNTRFHLEKLKKESRENKKSRILKRISFIIPKTNSNKVNIKIDMNLKIE